MAREVIYAPEARDDLFALYLYIAENSSDDRALGFVQNIEAICAGLSDFPERGMRRDDLFPGLRILGHERKVSIAFHVTRDHVVIDRIAYRGRDIEALF